MDCPVDNPFYGWKGLGFFAPPFQLLEMDYPVCVTQTLWWRISDETVHFTVEGALHLFASSHDET